MPYIREQSSQHKGARGKSSSLIPLTAGERAGTTPIRRAVTEHRPPPSSQGRRAPDRLGAAQPEVLLLIGVATAETLDEISLIGRRPGSSRRANLALCVIGILEVKQT